VNSLRDEESQREIGTNDDVVVQLLADAGVNDC
jgi:hypothetical protein